jgi:hypothetical protein
MSNAPDGDNTGSLRPGTGAEGYLPNWRGPRTSWPAAVAASALEVVPSGSVLAHTHAWHNEH